MAEQEEVVLKLPRGNRGALVVTRDAESLRLHQLYPDEQTGEIRATKGFRFKLAELEAVGALFIATARSIDERDKKNAAAAAANKPAALTVRGENKQNRVPPGQSAPAVEVLPKTAAVFVGTRHTANRGGICVVCGSNVLKGEAYLWSDDRQVGAHLGCGRENVATTDAQGKNRPPRAEPTPAQRLPSPGNAQRELPRTRRQPQDDNVGAVPEEERRLAEELF